MITFLRAIRSLTLFPTYCVFKYVTSRFISTTGLFFIFLSSLVIGPPIVGHAIVLVWVGTVYDCE